MMQISDQDCLYMYISLAFILYTCSFQQYLGLSANTHYMWAEGKNGTALELICVHPFPPPPLTHTHTHTHTTHIDLCGGHSCLGLHSLPEGVHLGLKLLLQLIQMFRTQQNVSLEGRRKGGREGGREKGRNGERKGGRRNVCRRRLVVKGYVVIYASHI